MLGEVISTIVRLCGLIRASDFDRISAFVLVTILSLPSVVNAASDSARVDIGRQLYFHGTSLNESEPLALIGPESTPVPASIMSCSGCHGDDGSGRAEGVVVPPDITWRYLTKPYGHKHPNGRTHPAFSEKTLATAIEKGTDPAGNQLDPTMPRYQFSAAQMSALIAYLKQIKADPAPGVSDDSIRLAAVLPLKGALVGAGEEMKAVLAAYFKDLNEHGGIYNRKIELQTIDSSESPADMLANARKLIESRQIFAIIAASLSAAENELPALAEQAKIPFLGAMTLYPEDGATPHRTGFYLFSGIDGQMRVLIDFAAANLKQANPKVAIVYPENGNFEETLAAIDAQSKLYHWNSPMKIAYPPGQFDALATVKSLQKKGAGVVLFLGGGAEFGEVLAATNVADWRPYFLASGSSVPSGIFTLSNDLLSRVALAFPTVPSDWSPEGIAAFNTLQEKAGFTSHHLATQIIAYCSARIIVEGIKLSGRQFSSGKFISALEKLDDFETGLTPKLSYGPNRHTGINGSYIVGLDPKNKQFKVLGDWRPPRD